MYLSHNRGLGATSGEVAALIEAAAPAYGVPPSLALAVAQRESGLNQAARGSSGEIGVFQLMPGTAAELGVNPADLNANIDGGLRYLAQMYRQFGDWDTALQAYNGGPGNVARGTVSSAAQSYSAAVLAAAGLSDSTLAALPVGSDTGDVLTGQPGVSGALVAGLALAAAGLVIWAAS